MAADAEPQRGGAPKRRDARSSVSSAWLTADSLAGFDRRTRMAAAAVELAEELARARHEAAHARWELRRIRARRSVRLGKAVRVLRTDGVRAGLRASAGVMRSIDVGPPPTPPEPAAAAPDAPQHAPFSDLDRYDHPNLRIGHVGATARYGSCAPHVALTEHDWPAVLDGGLDLVVVEPPADGSLRAWIHEVLTAARTHGMPTVVVHEDGGRVSQDVLALADLEVLETTAGSGPGRPSANRSEGAVLPTPPTTDPAIFNPVGWRAVTPDPVVAVATSQPDDEVLSMLAAFDPPVGLIVTADVEVDRLPDRPQILRRIADPDRLVRSFRRATVLLDHPGLHADPVDSSRLRAAAAATGVCVVALEASVPTVDRPLVTMAAPGDAEERTHRLLTDLDERERTSIRARRAALTERPHGATFDRILGELGILGRRSPLVSVVVSTNRPAQLEHVLTSFRRQGYPAKELILVLHGEGFPGVLPTVDDVEPAAVLRRPSSFSLGDCLNAGIEVARGDLVAKMDDDDHYGPDHLGDLVLAQRYSGADLVGKRVEFIHLAGGDVTIRRSARRPERFIGHVSGPTLLMTAEVARRVGFRRLPSRVDSTLCERVAELGGRIYRTHSHDVILERHGDGHTWTVEDEELLSSAVDSRPGLDLGWASTREDASSGSPSERTQ